jgi:AcrR family transcriptional regulator/DNA-binding transcriptional ArsR family regulator
MNLSSLVADVPEPQVSGRRELVIADPRSARVLAHAARVGILNRLIAEGPATATECAGVVGLSPSACSYHMRTLLRYGFVRAASQRADGRQRVWQAEAPSRLAELRWQSSTGDGEARTDGSGQQANGNSHAAQTEDWRTFPPLPLDPVLRAAVEAFVELGYHGATVGDIARRCGLSKPGTYHYYPRKEEMLVAILDLTMADLLERSRTAIEEGGADPVRRFALLVECLSLFHTHRGDLAFIGASEMRSLEAAHRERIARLRTEQQRMLDAEVAAAAAAGRFTTRFAPAASRAVGMMCTGLAQWYRPHGPLSPEEIAEQYVGFALDMMGYRGPEEGDARPQRRGPGTPRNAYGAAGRPGWQTHASPLRSLRSAASTASATSSAVSSG